MTVALVVAGLDQKINQRARAGEESLARRTPLAAIGATLPLRLRLEHLQERLEIDERLQVRRRHPLLGKLGDQHM